MPIRFLAARAAASSILILVVMAALPVAAQTVTVGDASATCGGSNFTVPVTVQSASGMLALEFRVSYDPARMTFNSASTGSMTSGFTMSSNASGSFISVAMASGSPVSGNGTVATLSFKPAANFTAGDVTMSLSQLRINDVTVTGRTGTVHLTCAPPTPAPHAPALTSPSNNEQGVDAPVRLRWSAAANATTYRVYFGTSENPAFLATSSNTNENVTTEPSTKYFWRIRAVNEAGTADSPIFSFTTGASSCASMPAPQQVRAEPEIAASGTPVKLSWNAAAGVTGAEYVVEESRDAGFSAPTSTTTNDTSVTITRTVDTEMTFFFRVRTRGTTSCGTATSDPSSVVPTRFTTQAPPPPPAATAHAFLVIVGSGPGANGSFFHTGVQLHNPSDATMNGRLVFHPAGTPGSASDPSLPYSLPPSSTKSFADIVTALGTTGFGSLDIVSETPPAAPLTVVRIYNDAGASGSNGMTLQQLTANDAVGAGQRTVLLAPTQPAAMRLNIGVRTLDQGATVRMIVSDRNGVAIGVLARAFPANYFEQVPLSGLTSAPLTGDEVVVVQVESGSALIYGATTDNVTQDPAIQIGRPVE